MFSDNDNLKDFVDDKLNCMVHSQRFISEEHNSLRFSVSFALGKKETPSQAPSQCVRILTDDEETNRKNNTLGKVLEYNAYDNYADVEVMYAGIGGALKRILFNNGKELRCMAYCTEDIGIKIMIFLKHV